MNVNRNRLKERQNQRRETNDKIAIPGVKKGVLGRFCRGNGHRVRRWVDGRVSWVSLTTDATPKIINNPFQCQHLANVAIRVMDHVAERRGADRKRHLRLLRRLILNARYPIENVQRNTTDRHSQYCGRDQPSDTPCV
jgi:hypothetical protein